MSLSTLLISFHLNNFGSQGVPSYVERAVRSLPARGPEKKEKVSKRGDGGVNEPVKFAGQELGSLSTPPTKHQMGKKKI